MGKFYVVLTSHFLNSPCISESVWDLCNEKVMDQSQGYVATHTHTHKFVAQDCLRT